MIVPASSDGTLRRAYGAAAVLCLAALGTLVVDMPLSSAARDVLDRASLDRLWFLAELFGDGVVVLLIVLALGLLHKLARPFLVRVLACAYGGGLAADLIKVFVVRTRPRAWESQGDVLQSFQGLRPWDTIHQGWAVWDSGLQSFPSAHTATAAGLAMGLAWLYPRGRWAFAGLAGLVACQRVVVGAHFPSDTLVGAAVGSVVAAYLIDRRGLGFQFDAWEARRRNVQPSTPGPPLSAPNDVREIQSIEPRRPRA